MLEVWKGLPREIHRPAPGRVRNWLREWSDDAALVAELRRLRAHGHLAYDTDYIQACLASARRRPRPWHGGGLVAELRALAEREPMPTLDLVARLDRLAEALPQWLPDRAAWRARIRRLTGQLDSIELDLGRLDVELLDLFEGRLDERGRAALERRVAAALRPLAGRLSNAARREAAAVLRRRLLRRDAGLPLLTLFSAVAQGERRTAGDGDGG